MGVKKKGRTCRSTAAAGNGRRWYCTRKASHNVSTPQPTSRVRLCIVGQSAAAPFVASNRCILEAE